MSTPARFLGIDVGTGSARAGVFTADGRLLASASRPIQMWKPAPDFVEQSSDDIWAACGEAARQAVADSGVPPAAILGVGFDATCSLVLLDAQDRPVSFSPTGRTEQNVIVWMDHRAIPQSARINATKHPVLRHVGGVISPEMQTPKLLWLKENLPAAWKKTARFLDLPDYLTYRATGDDTRSLCTTVCKWTYLGHRGPDGAGWDTTYFKKIGLGDLATEGFRRIGTRVRPMGEPLGRGLTATAAQHLGLVAGTAVGVAIIDAHAGGLGLLGASFGSRRPTPAALEHRLALIGGTSSCHMAVSARPRFIGGIWGPYHSAMIPGLWLTEGGQTATGALIDHVIQTHAAYAELQAEAARAQTTVYAALNTRLEALAAAERVSHPAALTADLHVYPNFHGNRSPLADPTLRGAIVGLPLSATLDDLARLYLATIQAVAHGTREIIAAMNRRGYAIDTIFACGGGTKNPVFLREHADITGCKLVLAREPEAVLLGSAVLGAVAAGAQPDVFAAMRVMNHVERVITPGPARVRRYHDAKHRVFLRLHRDFMAYRSLMAG
ncbi:MAG: FGGY-family carbohydrate kinase [Opitutus sp.]|nr:FGGY-family carbohydrate kinase [Opitutus sp.]MCS6246584.1 FGGY-family carbohydrate kinase [Opitutus sp.]MCS6272732.1 FGGY-family carbohydrate kinase [Opitutus sp.]MCS6276363.1 FGGY-family carbohydrate kinase [Opitutus sp.]MCS6301989.1 FGGY-family carbohydrate kinase [Opitutus sp.]